MDKKFYNQQITEAEERGFRQRKRHTTNNWLKIGSIINIMGALSFWVFFGLAYVLSVVSENQQSGNASEESSDFTVSITTESDLAYIAVAALYLSSILVLVLSIVLLVVKIQGVRICVSVFLTLMSFANLAVIVLTMGAILFCCTTWYLLIPPVSYIVGSLLCLIGCFVRSL